MFKKLTDIYIKSKSNSKKKGYSLPNSATAKLQNNSEGENIISNINTINANSTNRKWELFRITQDNQIFFKRLIECKSSYLKRNSFSNKEDSLINTKNRFYSKSNFYPGKKEDENINNSNKDIPSSSNDTKSKTNVDFFKNKTNNTGKRRGVSIDFLVDRKNETDKGFHDKKYILDKLNCNSNINSNVTSNKNVIPSIHSPVSLQATSYTTNKKKIMYRRKGFVTNLSIVNIKFYLENKQFILLIDPISIYSNKIFMLSFETAEQILLLKKTYKNYEQIINDLEFNGQNVVLNNSAELIYVNIY
jgi:hypothetical protein